MSELVARSQYCKAKGVRTFGLTLNTSLKVVFIKT